MDDVWTGAAIALLSAGVGAFLGAYAKSLVEWFRRPKLRIFPIKRPKGRANGSLLYFAIGVVNGGRTSAKNSNIYIKLQDADRKLLASGLFILLSRSSNPDGSIHPTQVDERDLGSIDLEQKTISVSGMASHPLADVKLPLMLEVSVAALDAVPVFSTFELSIIESDINMVMKHEGRT